MPATAADLLDLVLRWGHILSAIFLMGGTFFMRVALVPAMAELPEKERDELADRVRGPWGMVVMTSIAVLLVSGMINIALIMSRNTFAVPAYYHSLLTVKLLMALAIFYIASMLTGRSEAAAAWRQNLTFWLNVNLTLAITIVLIAGAMRFAGRTPKGSDIDPKDLPKIEAPM